MNTRRYFALFFLLFGMVCVTWSQVIPDSVKIWLQTSPGAEIGINGEYSSTNQMRVSVPVGKHKVVVSYGTSFQKEYEIDVAVGGQTEFEFSVSGKVNVNSVPGDASVYVDGAYHGKTPATLDLIGNHTIKVSKDPSVWYDEERIIDVDLMSESNLDFVLKKIPPREYVKNSHFYLEGDYLLLNFPGYGGAVGFYLDKWNFEFGFMVGSSETDEIHWYDRSALKVASVTYSANRMHIKAGYGLRVAPRVQVTPQIGGALLSLSGSDGRGDDKFIDSVSDTYAVLLVGGVRMTYAVLPCMQVVVTPEYTATLKKGSLYKQISDLNGDIKGWGTGLNVKVGLSIYF